MRIRMMSALVTVLSVGALFAASGGVAQAADPLGAVGAAYGTYASVGNTLVSGPSANVSQSVGKPGQHQSNSVATVNVPGLLTTGAVDTSVASTGSTSQLGSVASSHIADVNILNGLITASAVDAGATAWGPNPLTASPSGTGVLSVSILGHGTIVNPQPNTTITLPGIGKVVLNEQSFYKYNGEVYLDVHMIHVYVTANLLNVTAGTQIAVGRAFAEVKPIPQARLCGVAYATSAHAGTLVNSSPSWLSETCVESGHSGANSNPGASVNIPGVLTSGTLDDVTSGNASSSSTTGAASSTVQNLDVLKGLITANVVQSSVHASGTATSVSLADSGSSLANLRIAGQPVSANPAPNTTITVGNIKIVLHQVVRSAKSITVRAIDITVGGSNKYGLPAGSEIQVATSELSTSV